MPAHPDSAARTASDSLDLQLDRSGKHLTVYVAGDLGAEQMASLTEQIISHTDSSVHEVWIDLSTVTSCDPAGVETFLTVSDHANTFGARTVIYHPQAAVSQLLAASGVDQAVHVIGPRAN